MIVEDFCVGAGPFGSVCLISIHVVSELDEERREIPKPGSPLTKVYHSSCGLVEARTKARLRDVYSKLVVG